jgi:hypothetical protein
MFEMFKGGKPDPMTLMAIEHEERRSDLARVVRFIKHNYTCGTIDIDDVAAECGVEDLTPEEINYIERKINER